MTPRGYLPVTFLAPAVYTTVSHRRLSGLSGLYRTSPLEYYGRALAG